MYEFIVQKLGVQADGKILLLLGKEGQNFNIEDGDDFYTVVFKTDPFDNSHHLGE